MKRMTSMKAMLGAGILLFTTLYPPLQNGALAMESSGVAWQQSQTTRWKGTLNAGGTNLRLEIDITDNPGATSGVLKSLDQGNAILELSGVSVSGDTLRFAVPQIGARFSGAYTSDRSTAAGTFTQGGAQFPLTLEKTAVTDAPDAVPEGQVTEAWVGELQMGAMRPVMQFRIVTLPSGDTTGFFDSVTEGRTGFPATWSFAGDSLKFDVAAISLTYRGVLNATRDSAEGIWSQGGRNVPLSLERRTRAYDSPNVWANRPQRPVGPFPYDAEDVTFVNTMDVVTLAGTLTLPRAPGRHPVVVLISGSGGQDRDETLMEHKPFLVLADYLTRRGIAVLRYDDRGTAESTGDFGAATTEDFARDASAAVEFLRHHDRIDPGQIGLAGHSEGGLVAPMVVGLRDDVAFVVLLGATGVDGRTIITSQTEAMMRVENTPEAEIAMVMALNRAVIDMVMEAPPGADLSEKTDSLIQQAVQTLPAPDRDEATTVIRQGVDNSLGRLQSRWMRFFLNYDPRPALHDITCPVLAVTGSKDVQVLPGLNLPEITKALTEAGNRDFTVLELEGLNHLFQESGTGSVSEYATIQETFNPGALKTIGDWIVERTTSHH